MDAKRFFMDANTIFWILNTFSISLFTSTYLFKNKAKCESPISFHSSSAFHPTLNLTPLLLLLCFLSSSLPFSSCLSLQVFYFLFQPKNKKKWGRGVNMACHLWLLWLERHGHKFLFLFFILTIFFFKGREWSGCGVTIDHIFPLELQHAMATSFFFFFFFKVKLIN